MLSPPAAEADPCKAARDAALAKLGRNVVLFQQLESRLKALYASLVVEGSDAASLKARHEKRRAVLATRSLGIVVDAVFDALAEEEPEDEDPKLEGGQRWHIRFRFRSTGPLLDQHRASLSALVDERNRIVHHLTDDHDLHSAAGIAALDCLLDPQADRIHAELRALDQLFTAQQGARQHAAEFLASPEFREQMELRLLQASALITGMAILALERPRKDGWTVLSTAAQELRRRDPGAFADLKARYGHDKLKPLLMASGVFELAEERTARGGTRVVYRPVVPAQPSV